MFGATFSKRVLEWQAKAKESHDADISAKQQSKNPQQKPTPKHNNVSDKSLEVSDPSGIYGAGLAHFSRRSPSMMYLSGTVAPGGLAQVQRSPWQSRGWARPRCQRRSTKPSANSKGPTPKPTPKPNQPPSNEQANQDSIKPTDAPRTTSQPTQHQAETKQEATERRQDQANATSQQPKAQRHKMQHTNHTTHVARRGASAKHIPPDKREAKGRARAKTTSQHNPRRTTTET